MPLPEEINPAVIQTITQDKFARTALEATRQFLYVHFRRWDKLSTEGKLLFENEEAGLSYMALSILLGLDPIKDLPDVGELKINVGGAMLSAAYIQELQNVFTKKATEAATT